MKTKILISAIIIGLTISCSVKINMNVSEHRIYYGDSVKVSWDIKESRLIKQILMNTPDENLPLTGEQYFKPKKDTTVELTVVTKNNKFPYKIKKKIIVLKPQILEFSAFRDRFETNKIKISWNVKGATDVSIEGIKYNLPNKGIEKINLTQSANFTLVAKTAFQTLTKTCFVEEAPTNNQRPMIIKDTAICDLKGKHKINLKIIETGLDNYPNEIKLKVIAYDSLGNFITKLAPPFGTDEIAKKYFHRVVDKVNNVAQEVKFEVKEIHSDLALYDVALTLDYSGSMTPFMSFYEKATKKFIEAKFPDDNYSVVKFDHRLGLYSPLQTDAKKIINNAKLSGADTLFGGTALYAGIDKGLESLDKGKNKKILIPFTDGYENSSLNFIGRYASTISELVRKIRMKNAKLMMIGLGSVNVTLLQELAYYTNGDFYYMENPNAITQVYKDLQHNMRTYYEISIKPLKYEGEHQVQITYFNNIDTTTTTRPCYIGDAIDFTKFEVDTNAYWYDKKLAKNKIKLVTSPQTLINFDHDEDKIRPDFGEQISNIAKYMKNNPKTIIRIFGHTDTKGKEDHNDNLSLRRAEAIKLFLISKGIGPKRVQCFGMASKYPIHKNDKQEWAAKENRRVEVVLWKNPEK